MTLEHSPSYEQEMGVVSELDNESNASLETNDQTKPEGYERDGRTSLNDPIISPMKENDEEVCDVNVKSRNENMSSPAGLSAEVETSDNLSRRHKLKRNAKPNAMSTPEEKVMALEERKIAFEERKLAIQKKKIAIEEKKLLLESQKLALLKEKQNLSRPTNNLANHCGVSDDAESPLRERTNVFEVLMSCKQHSAVTSTTENNVVKEKPKKVEDIDAKINSRKLKEKVKVRLEELSDKKLSKKKCPRERDCFPDEHSSNKKRIVLISESDEEGKGNVDTIVKKPSRRKRHVLLSDSDDSSMQGKVFPVDVMTLPEGGSDLPANSSRGLESKSSTSKKSAKKKRLCLMSDESSDEVCKEKPTKTTKSPRILSLKQSKLKLRRDSESDHLSSPPPNEKKRNSLFNYFNSISKKEVAETPEKTVVQTNSESSPTNTKQKSVDADVMPVCVVKSKLKLLPTVILQQLDSELNDKQLTELKTKTTNQNGCRRSPRKKESSPTKLVSETKDSTLSAQEKMNTKPKSSKKPWQMRIKPASSTTTMDLFTKVLSDNEDLVIDDESDSDGPIFNTKKIRQETITSKKDANLSKKSRSLTVGKEPLVQDTNKARSKEARSPIVRKKAQVQDTNEVHTKETRSPIIGKKSWVQNTKKVPSKEAQSPIVAKKTRVKDTNEVPSKEARSPIVPKKTRVQDTKKVPSKEARSPIVANKTRVQDTNEVASKEVRSPIVPKKSWVIKERKSSTSKSSSENINDKSETKSKKKVWNTIEMSNSRSKRSEKSIVDKSKKIEVTLDDDIEIVETKASAGSQTSKAPIKLAPLFMKKQQTPKEIVPVVDPSILEARQRFLMSGVPDCMKKITDVIFRDKPEDTIFPTMGTSHVTQQDSSDIWNLPQSDLKLSPLIASEQFTFVKKTIPLGSFISNKTTVSSILNQPSRPTPINPALCRTFIKSLKLENPDFPYPMYRMFKLLREKNVKLQQSECSSSVNAGKKKKSVLRLTTKRKRVISDSEEETKRESVVSDNRFQMWTEKYKPLSGDEVIGNKNCVKQLKLWLESWKKFRNCDNPKSLGRKKKRTNSSSEDEFINDSSDDDDTENMPGNTAILYGPHGCGKTSIVYALANELGFEVLESNASTKRTGKCLLAEFQGATQIHRLCSKSEQSGSVDKFLKPTGKSKKKVVQKAKPVEKDSTANSKMSIVLIDDADIVFEDNDEGFITALATLVTTSRRPIIFIANNSECPHLARFYEDSLVLDLSKPNIGHTSIWLQMICLLEGVRASNDTIQRLLKLYNGDISRSLLQLQVWVLAGGNNVSKVSESDNSAKKQLSSNKVDLEDDDSNSSWVGSQGNSADCDAIPVHNECIETFIGNGLNLCPFPVNLSSLWWNLAPILSMPEMRPKRPTTLRQCESSEPPKELYERLQSEYCGSDEEGSPEKTKSVPVTEIPESADTVVSEKPMPEPSSKKVSAATGSDPKSEVDDHRVCTRSEMDAVARLMEDLSAMAALAAGTRLDVDTYDVGPCQRVWERGSTDGVSTVENLGPCQSQEELVSRSIIHSIAEGCIRRCWQTLETTGTEPGAGYDPVLPTDEVVRWRYDQQAADNTIVDLVPPNQLSDHRAIFTDYIPALQSICSHEMRRFERNTTRMNRFFHYLKGLGIHASDETLNVLASSFRNGLWQVGD